MQGSSTPVDCFPDIRTSELPIANRTRTEQQSKEEEIRASVIEAYRAEDMPDRFFGEPLSMFAIAMDPRALNMTEWLGKDWDNVHGARVAIVQKIFR